MASLVISNRFVRPTYEEVSRISAMFISGQMEGISISVAMMPSNVSLLLLVSQNLARKSSLPLRMVIENLNRAGRNCWLFMTFQHNIGSIYEHLIQLNQHLRRFV